MKKNLSESEIDQLVINQADDLDEWEFEARVEKMPKAISLRLDSVLIEKLKILSKVHNEKGYQSLIKRWIDEHVDQEVALLKASNKLQSSDLEALLADF